MNNTESIMTWFGTGTAVLIGGLVGWGLTYSALSLIHKPPQPTAGVTLEAPVAKPAEPPPDSRFRYIRSSDGLWAIEVLQDNGTWTIGPTYNVWRTKPECRHDMDWWKAYWAEQEAKARRVWTNSN